VKIFAPERRHKRLFLEEEFSVYTEITDNSVIDSQETLSKAARTSFLKHEQKPLFDCDWMRALFIHYEVDAAGLQREVPYELDLHRGRAYVSLVAFEMVNLRLRSGRPWSGVVTAPIATHGFLNVRTYVRHNGEPGIYFLTEWLPNRLSVLLGPLTFGLPYRFGQLDYRHDHDRGMLDGNVSASGLHLSWTSRLDLPLKLQRSAPGSLDEFLLERYIAFTSGGMRKMSFRVWHLPWRQQRTDVHVHDDGLLKEHCNWYGASRCAGANYSPGVHGVWVGRPRVVRA
jgi:uncharacterized protein